MGFTPAISRTDTSLYKAIVKVSEQAFGAPVIPTVAGGFTDSHFFRDLGITSYGYSPFVYAPGEFSGVHGNDERFRGRKPQERRSHIISTVGRFCCATAVTFSCAGQLATVYSTRFSQSDSVVKTELTRRLEKLPVVSFGLAG